MKTGGFSYRYKLVAATVEVLGVSQASLKWLDERRNTVAVHFKFHHNVNMMCPFSLIEVLFTTNETKIGGTITSHCTHQVCSYCIRKYDFRLKLRTHTTLPDQGSKQPYGAIHLSQLIPFDRLPFIYIYCTWHVRSISGTNEAVKQPKPKN